MIYIIIYNPSLRLIGPFSNAIKAGAWGRGWQKANHDNPCWNLMRLEGEPIGELVIAVERPSMAEFVRMS